MVILGIDPGYATTGFGVVQSLPGTLKLLNYGTITTPTTLTFPQRLEMLYDDMVQLIDTVRPDAIAVEELFWGHNVTTGIGVSHGRGVILLAIAKSGVPLFEYTPCRGASSSWRRSRGRMTPPTPSPSPCATRGARPRCSAAAGLPEREEHHVLLSERHGHRAGYGSGRH